MPDSLNNKVNHKLLQRKLDNLLGVARKVESKICQLLEGMDGVADSYDLWAQYLFIFVIFKRINDILKEFGKEQYDYENIKSCRNALAHPEVTELHHSCLFDNSKNYCVNIKKGKDGNYPAYKHWLMKIDISDPNNTRIVKSYIKETLVGLEKHTKLIRKCGSVDSSV